MTTEVVRVGARKIVNTWRESNTGSCLCCHHTLLRLLPGVSDRTGIIFCASHEPPPTGEFITATMEDRAHARCTSTNGEREHGAFLYGRTRGLFRQIMQHADTDTIYIWIEPVE